jgi:hypothetical protein
MSHRQHQAGCPPTVQRGSGRSPRCRQSSTVSRWTPSRSLISANPTGSCFLCWSAIEQLGQVVVPEQSERAPHMSCRPPDSVFQVELPLVGLPKQGVGARARSPAQRPDERSPGALGCEPGDRPLMVTPQRRLPVIATPAVRARHWRPARRECGSHLTGGPSTRWLADIRGAGDGLPGPPHRRTVECAAYPNRLRVIRRGESPRRP